MPQASRLLSANFFFKSSRPRAASKYHAGMACTETEGAMVFRASVSASAARISEGVMRASSAARVASVAIVARKEPFVSVSQTRA